MNDSPSKQPSNLLIFQNDNSIFITTIKIGCRFISNTLKKPYYNHTINSSSGPFTLSNMDESLLNEFNKNEVDVDNYMETIKKDWNSILNKTSKKDIVILYRNPYKRFLSAIIQDAELIFDWNVFIYLKSLLLNLGYSAKDIDYLHKFKNGNMIDKSIDADELKKMLYIVYKIFIDDMILNGANGYHSGTTFSSYMNPISYLLTSDIIDINKVKLFNLDDGSDGISNYLKSIESTPSLNRYSHSNKIDIVESILEEQTSEKIDYLIKDEILGYSILENLKNKIMISNV